ncbi:30S ribosomal protein S21, partial [Francisella tularensis subsp. holarctica]|uniref:30S ribosomal protein S21 n=1 Tax=Francisella tularensis TaxID=263 RepID=UPI002381ABED
MLSIRVDEHKPFDISLRYFKRACEKAGIKQELRYRQHYVKTTEKRKRAKRQAVKRARSSQRRAFI